MTTRPKALVTGGSKRIGREICLTLAKAGYEVLVHYHASLAEAEELAKTLNGKTIGDATRMQGVSLLVNNASLFQNDDFGTLDYALFDAHMNVNFKIPVQLMEVFSKQTETGSIVNIIDQRVLKPTPLLYSYALSKEALWAATKMTAQALAPRIRVNAVAPGPSLKNERQGEEDFKRQYEATLLKHASFPTDIAKTVLFLAQNDSITGQIIAVDSGQHLAWKTVDAYD